MTTFKTLQSLAIGFAASLLAGTAYADSLLVVLSPAGSEDQKRAEAIDMLALAIEATQPGETSYFINGVTGQSICTINVPDKKAYRSDRAKLNVNRACAAQIMSFPRNDTVALGWTPHAGALDIAGTLRSVVQNYDMSQIDAVVMVGNPLYHDPRHADLSMLAGHVYSEGHVAASVVQSHFGMAGFDEALAGTPVHITFDGYDWVQNSAHEDAVHRVTALTIGAMGGALVTYNGDRSRLIERVKSNVSGPVRTFTRDETATKREMIFVGSQPSDFIPIHERELSQAPLATSETLAARNIEVGITWKCACDLDIYVRPNPRADVLYFGHQSTREGTFFKDYRHSAELKNGLESAHLSAPVDLREMLLGINFYGGSAPRGVEGEIRLTLNGETYARAFSLEATNGNAAQGAQDVLSSGSSKSPHWTVLSGFDVVRDHVSDGAG